MNDPDHQLERAAKTLPLVLAGLYVMGFLIVALHLAGYGASSLDLIKIQYLTAGFWFGCACVMFYGISTPPSLWVAEFLHHKAESGFWRRRETCRLAGTLSTGPLMAVLVWTVTPLTIPFAQIFGSEEFTQLDIRATERIRSVRVLFVAFVIFSIVLRTWILLREKSTESSSHQHFIRYVWRFFTPFVGAVFLFCVVAFTFGLYPRIPFSFGGGEPRQVMFWLGTATDSFLERDGTTPYTVPYELLLENENSLVVISPKDNQRAIEFDRKAVGAVIVLGKRPKSAPAHFLRGGTSASQEGSTDAPGH
jgi:hypothetical protein